MNFDKKSFKRYQREYSGSYFDTSDRKDSTILDRIEEMSSYVERGDREFQEHSGMYETECQAVWESKDGKEKYSFPFIEATPQENLDTPIFDIDEDGNSYQVGWKRHEEE